jgi:hypothetical protein
MFDGPMPAGSKYRGRTFGHADGRRCRLSTWRAANKANEIEMCLEAVQPNCDTLVEAHDAWAGSSVVGQITYPDRVQFEGRSAANCSCATSSCLSRRISGLGQSRLSGPMPSMSVKGGKADVWEWANKVSEVPEPDWRRSLDSGQSIVTPVALPCTIHPQRLRDIPAFS